MGANFEIVLRMTQASTESRWDDVASCVTEDVTAWSPMYQLEGREAWRQAIHDQNASFDDVRVDQRLLAEDGNRVITEWTWSIPHPSGSGRAVLPGMSVYEFEDGLIADLRQYCDMAGFGATMEGEPNG